MPIKTILFTLGLAVVGNAMAGTLVNSYYCSTGQYVYVGDSLNSALTKCGAPASTQEVNTPSSKPTLVTQWVYNYQNRQATMVQAAQYQAAAFIVNMINNKVVSLLVNAQAVQSSNFCGPNQVIAVGSTNFQVQQLCGTPSQIQQVTQDIPQKSVHQTIVNYTSSFSPVIMTAENGAIVSIQIGN